MSYPFIIWTTHRTGGTSLTGLLTDVSEHQNAQPEPFNWRPNAGYERQFGHITRAWSEAKNETALSKSLSEILADRYLIKHCYAMPIFHPKFNIRFMEAAAKTDYRHLHLLRRDEASRLISFFVAQAYGTWHKKHATQVFSKVLEGKRRLAPLPVDKVVTGYKRSRQITEDIRRSLRELNIEVREVYTEDLYAGEREHRIHRVENLLEFLGFGPEVIERSRERIEEALFHGGQNTASVTRFVPNLQEVVAALTAAGCEPPATDFAALRPKVSAGPKGRRRREPLQATGEDKPEAADGSPGDKVPDLPVEFLKKQGLKPHDRFIEIGCDGLRNRSQLIQYLAPGCYHAIDKEIESIIYGVALGIGLDLYREKMPRLIVSENFEFQKFGEKFTYGIAPSLFTHALANEIFTCLTKLNRSASQGCRFYAGFWEATEGACGGETASRGRNALKYSVSELTMLGTMAGWHPVYIGEWGHPREQRMMEFIRA